VGTTDGFGSSAKFRNPSGITTDGSGNLYVADASNNLIRKIVISTGEVTTFAGSGVQGSADGTGTAARFNSTTGVTVDVNGNVNVADQYNMLIRKITPTGVVSTLAGTGMQGTSDGIGTAAYFSYPTGITVDGSGNLFVTDWGVSRIRKIVISTGVVTTVAGNLNFGNTDGVGPAATFNAPTGVGLDASGNMYISDKSNHRIRKITSSGVVSTIAGSTVGSTDGIGTAAKFNNPNSVAVDGNTNLYIADQANQRIRKISPTGVVTTLAGGIGGFSDGTGTSARFNAPSGVCLDGSGNIYVSDASNKRIRIISSYRIDPALPAGLIFDPRTGTISGTPTAAMAAKAYTIYAQNSAGTNTTTLTLTIAGPPTVATSAASNVTSGGATLNAMVNANGGTTSSITIKYSTSQADVDAGNGISATVSPASLSGNTVTNVSAAITGLTASTTHYYRVSATNVAGTTNGSTLPFITSAPPPNISYSVSP
jgi:sugar lactone lactonase YvrE